MEHKRKGRWKRLPIPDDELTKLKDVKIPEIDRVALAEHIRADYSYPLIDMSILINVREAQYHRFLKILRSGNTTLINILQQNKCTLHKALFLLENPQNIESCIHYPFLKKIKARKAEILFENNRYILYRHKGNLYFGIINNNNLQKLYQLDDQEYALNTITSLLDNGCTINTDLVVRDAYGNYLRMLYHHLIAVFAGLSVDEITKVKVCFKRKPYAGIHDLRISNITCKALSHINHPDVYGGINITKNGDTIYIINQNTGETHTTDYSSDMYNLLVESRDDISYQARDRRVGINVDGRFEYLYHIVLAIDMYGYPTDLIPLRTIMEKFKSNCLRDNNTVDHLDGDCTNNKLKNLIILTEDQNTRKAAATKWIRKFGKHYFCFLEAVDDKSVRIRAGYHDAVKLPTYMIDKVFFVNEFIDKMEDFVAGIKGDKLIWDAVRKQEYKEMEESNGE